MPLVELHFQPDWNIREELVPRFWNNLHDSLAELTFVQLGYAPVLGLPVHRISIAASLH